MPKNSPALAGLFFRAFMPTLPAQKGWKGGPQSKNVAQRRLVPTRHGGAETHVIQLGLTAPRQASMSRKLSRQVSWANERHGEELFPTGEGLGVAVASIAGHAAAEVTVGEKADQLREDALAFVDPSMLRGRGKGRRGFQIEASTNRR